MTIALGLNTAVRALITSQQALNTTAHNIANANTPGFTRQDVHLITTEPFTFPTGNRAALAGQVGTGVTISEVRRIRDQFLDTQFRLQNQGLGQQDTLAQGLHQIEDFFNEPSDHGLGQQLARFWSAWSALVADPQPGALASRITLRAQASDLTAFIRGANSQLVQQQQHLDEQVLGSVDQINGIAKQIGALNDQIGSVLAVGDTPNDLRDRRDLLLDQLSKITRVSAFENDRGIEMVTMGGVQLIGDGFVNTVTTQLSGGFHALFWSSDNSSVTITGGEIKGLLNLRDTTIPGLRTDLNTLAATLVSDVNAQHELGHTLNDSTNNSLASATGIDFFKTVAGKEAATIDISDDVQNDTNNIAAGTNSGAPGDSANAVAIADLKFSLLVGESASLAGDGTATVEDFYRGMISKLGTQGQQAQNQAANQQLLVQHLDTSRQSISGVSLDEEATKQIEFQRAFEGAARLVSTFDSMLDTIINRMGAGR